ncbi:MAG TPA: hypothetical protein VF529_15335 [Solirubrobacteraceae bacterium]|jgi:hypothetical protein
MRRIAIAIAAAGLLAAGAQPAAADTLVTATWRAVTPTRSG